MLQACRAATHLADGARGTPQVYAAVVAWVLLELVLLAQHTSVATSKAAGAATKPCMSNSAAQIQLLLIAIFDK